MNQNEQNNTNNEDTKNTIEIYRIECGQYEKYDKLIWANLAGMLISSFFAISQSSGVINTIFLLFIYIILSIIGLMHLGYQKTIGDRTTTLANKLGLKPFESGGCIKARHLFISIIIISSALIVIKIALACGLQISFEHGNRPINIERQEIHIKPDDLRYKTFYPG